MLKVVLVGRPNVEITLFNRLVILKKQYKDNLELQEIESMGKEIS